MSGITYSFVSAGLVIFVGSLITALFIFFKNPKSKINILFSLFVTSVSIYGFGFFKQAIASTPSQEMVAIKILLFGTILIPVFFLHATYTLLNKKIYSPILIGLYVMGFIFELINIFTNLLARDPIPKFGLQYIFQAGPLYPVLATGFAIGVGISIWRLFIGYRTSVGSGRNRLKYLFFGMFIGFLGGSPGFVLGYNINLFPVNPLSSYAVVLGNILLGYAIVKYRLMDIEVLIKKSLVFSGMFAFAFSVFVTSTLIVSQVVGGGRVTSLALSALIIVLLLRPLEKWLVNATDRFLFQKEYDQQGLLKDVSRNIVGKVDLIELKGFIVSFLSSRMKLENIDILVKSEFRDKALFNWHKGNKNLLLFDELGYLARKKQGDLTYLKNEMQQLKVAVSIPIFFENEPFWLLLLGNKKSGRVYTKEDMNTLEALSHEISIAIENAINFQNLKASQLELVRQENLKFVSVLVKGLAHEIFNPLTPLQHGIEDLNEKSSLSPFLPQTNGKIEAFNRIIKDEFFYPNTFESEKDLMLNLGNFLFEYNHLRKHGDLNYTTPFDKLESVTELLS